MILSPNHLHQKNDRFSGEDMMKLMQHESVFLSIPLKLYPFLLANQHL
jgi:hypothetical protein